MRGATGFLGRRVLATALIVTSLAAADAVPGAKALEARLYAPCCYNGTLDGHESDLARDLRAEIEHRIAAHETADAIQADFVARYGEKVVAARTDAPIRTMGLVVVALLLAAGAWLAIVLRRWTRRKGSPLPEGSSGARARSPGVARDDLDRRLDAELADLDAP